MTIQNIKIVGIHHVIHAENKQGYFTAEGKTFHMAFKELYKLAPMDEISLPKNLEHWLSKFVESFEICLFESSKAKFTKLGRSKGKLTIKA